MRLKYIMFECRTDDSKRHVPVIFPEVLTHALMAEALLEYSVEPLFARAKVRSAGFVTVSPLLHCHGESESLHVRAHPDDERIISTYEYLHGIAP